MDAKMISNIPLSTVKALEQQLNKSLEKNDLVSAKVYKKYLVKALKDYYGI